MNVVQEIDSQQRLFSPTVITILSKSREILDQLEELVKDKILKEVNGSLGVRRRAWAKYRSKVYGIQRSLADYRANLMIAIIANGS